MAAEYVWDNPQKTVMRYVLDGDWNWDQFHYVLDTSREEIRLLPNWVDVIVDMRTSNKLPPDTLANLRRVAIRRPPNGGLIVLVGGNAHMTSVYQAFKKIYSLLDQRLSIHFTGSLEEARAIVAKEGMSVVGN